MNSAAVDRFNFRSHLLCEHTTSLRGELHGVNRLAVTIELEGWSKKG